MNAANLVLDQVTARGAHPAIIDTVGGQPRSVTFAKLEDWSARAAAIFHDAGLIRGDRVLLLMPMSAELYVIVFAALRLGLVPTFVDPSAPNEYLERCIREADPKGLVATSKAHLLCVTVPAMRRVLVKIHIGFPIPGGWSWGEVLNHARLDEVVACEPDTAALLTYTSGSTGDPKPTVRTHGLLLAQHDALRRCLALDPDVVDLASLPVFVLANLASGATSVIAEGDLRRLGEVDPGPVLEQIRQFGVTRITASPALLESIIGHCRREAISLTGIKAVFTGGAPVFPGLLQAARSVAPLARIGAIYGATEAEPIAFLEYEEIEDEDWGMMEGGRGLLAGTLDASIDVRILDDRWGSAIAPLTPDAFDMTCLGADAPGEIVVRGPHVIQPRADRPVDDETTIVVGDDLWHRTGDAGCFDAQGRLWLLGRCDAKSDRDGSVMYPFPVECAAMAEPGISRAAFVGVDAERFLVVQLAPGVSDAVLDSVAENLDWAGLDRIELMAEVPVDQRHNAKIDYPALRRQLGAQPMGPSWMISAAGAGRRRITGEWRSYSAKRPHG